MALCPGALEAPNAALGGFGGRVTILGPFVFHAPDIKPVFGPNSGPASQPRHAGEGAKINAENIKILFSVPLPTNLISSKTKRFWPGLGLPLRGLGHFSAAGTQTGSRSGGHKVTDFFFGSGSN